MHGCEDAWPGHAMMAHACLPAGIRDKINIFRFERDTLERSGITDQVHMHAWWHVRACYACGVMLVRPHTRRGAASASWARMQRELQL